MKKIIKIFVDIIMTILLFLLTAYHWTGETIHEYLGFSLFVFFIAHHILILIGIKVYLKENIALIEY